jgi:hypothetical protein
VQTRSRGSSIGIVTGYGLDGPVSVPQRQERFFGLGANPDRLCGLVVRVLGYRSGGPGSIPDTTRKKLVGLEQGSL